MIPNPLIYNQNYAQIATDLTPPHKQLPGWIAWLTSLLSPLQRDQNLLFNSYAGGSAAANWGAFTIYHYGDQIIYIDGSVYELQYNGAYTNVTPPNQDPNWLRVQLTWIGARERAYYTGQTIFVEYILNKYFQVGVYSLPWTGASHVTQIYIANTTNSNSNFWLSNGGPGSLTSFMSAISRFQRNFLGNAYAYNPNSFTIMVPVAVYNAIAALQPAGVTSPGDPAPTAAGAAIRAVMNKYLLAGKIYTIATY